jgi:hypothetical protein
VNKWRVDPTAVRVKKMSAASEGRVKRIMDEQSLGLNLSKPDCQWGETAWQLIKVEQPLRCKREFLGRRLAEGITWLSNSSAVTINAFFTSS